MSDSAHGPKDPERHEPPAPVPAYVPEPDGGLTERSPPSKSPDSDAIPGPPDPW